MPSIKPEIGTAVVVQNNTSSAITTLNAATCATADLDNTATGAGPYLTCDIELVCTFASNPGAGEVVEVHCSVAPDGTNYTNIDNTTPASEGYMGAFNMQAVTTLQRRVLRDVLLPADKTRFWIRNRTAQSLPAGWTLTIYPHRLTS